MVAKILYNNTVLATLSDGETAVINCADKYMSDNIKVIMGEGDPEKEVIEFEINGASYTTEAGTKWRDFEDPNGNIQIYDTDAGQQVIVGRTNGSAQHLYYDVSYMEPVNLDDEIAKNGEYFTVRDF